MIRIVKVDAVLETMGGISQTKFRTTLWRVQGSEWARQNEPNHEHQTSRNGLEFVGRRLMRLHQEAQNGPWLGRRLELTRLMVCRFAYPRLGVAPVSEFVPPAYLKNQVRGRQ